MPKQPYHEYQLPTISPGLLVVTVSFASGICWAKVLHLQGEFLLSVILLLLILLFITRTSDSPRLKAVSYLLLGFLFLLLGLHHSRTYLGPPADPTHIYNLITDRQSVSLEGILQEYPVVITASSGQETKIVMKVNALHQLSDGNFQIQNHTRISGLVQLTLKGLLPDNLKPGDRFLVKTDVSPVNTYSTPGAFNYKKHLAAQAIHIKGWIQSPDNIMKLHTVGTSTLSFILTALKYFPECIRYHMANFLDKSLTQPARGLYKAILIGDRNDVPASVLENFTGAGCIHILAISGMHMGLLALVTIAILTWILKRSTWLLLHAPVLKIAVSLAFLPLLFYSLIAGFNIPILRAFLMTTVLILAILFDRPRNLVNHILLAVLLILTWNPAAIFTASFQLSFSAVTAIALIYPKLHRYLIHSVHKASFFSTKTNSTDSPTPTSIILNIPGAFSKWLLAGVALTTAAMLGTFPLLLFHFNRFSLVAPLTNLLVEPLICFWSLIVGLVACLFIPLFPHLAKALFVVGSFGLIIAEKICAFFSALPYSSLWLPTPSPVEMMVTYLFLFSLVLALHLTGKKRIFSACSSIILIFILLAAPAFTRTVKPPPGSVSVTFLDVGHGSSILLQLPGNMNILIDGGGAESDRFNIGERVIGPFLWHQKLSHLDAVVVTHPHADHYNGLPFILKRFRPKKLWINGAPGPDREYGELLNIASQMGIETKIATADETLFQAGTNRLLCIHGGSDQDYIAKNFKQARWINPNDLSLVLRLETKNKSFLFPADISGAMAEILINEGKHLKADVMMAPHHGSPSSMNQKFIKAVAPEFIAISAGRNNPFNFPATSFFDLQQIGIKVLTTGRNGTITFTMEDGEILASSYQVN